MLCKKLCSFYCSRNLQPLSLNVAYFNSHENSSGYYRVSSYYISKVLGDLIPLRIIPIPLFSFIAYWMIGMRLFELQYM